MDGTYNDDRSWRNKTKERKIDRKRERERENEADVRKFGFECDI